MGKALLGGAGGGGGKSQNRPPQNSRGARGMMDPNIQNMMKFKAAGGMANPMAQQYGQGYGPGAFGVDPRQYYKHFDQGGMVRQPQPKPNPMSGGLNILSSMFGGGQGIGGIDTGPSQSFAQNMGQSMGAMQRPYQMGQSSYGMGITGGGSNMGFNRNRPVQREWDSGY